MTDEPDEPDEAETDERVPLADLRADVDRRRGSTGDGPAVDGRPGAGDGDRAVAAPTEAEDDAPLSELRADVGSRSTEGDGPDEDPFFPETTPPLDSEAVWAELLMDEAETPGGFQAREPAEDGEDQVVSKGLCHRCSYFGDPPTLHCTHDGTTIRRVVDMDSYRVSNCPMVESTDPPADGE